MHNQPMRWVALACSVVLLAAVASCSPTLPTGPLPLGNVTQVTLPTRVIQTNTPVPTNTPTSTPTPTPTPTPLPAVRLADATRALFDGDYTTAGSQYNAVLAGPASTDEARAAQFGLAKAKLRAGDPEAASALETFAKTYPDDSRAADAWFLLGQARMNAKDYPGAVEAYRQYLKLRGDLIAPYVNQRIGDALRANKQPQAAAEAYRSALASAPNTSMALDLRERLAAALLDAQDTTGAVAQYDAILGVAQMANYRARIQSLAAQALVAAGQTAAAHQRQAALVDAYSANAANQLACQGTVDYAYDALVTLVGDNVPVNEFKRGLIDHCAEQYDPALAAFTRAIGAGKQVAESRYFAGLAFRAQGDTANALRQFNLIIQNFPNASVWGPAWLEMAQTYAAAGSADDALGVYRELASKYPSRPEAPEALWRAAQLLDRLNRDAEAAQAYRALQQAFPASSHASEALYRAGLTAHVAGDDKAALGALQTLSDTYPASDWGAPGFLWQGKLVLAQDNTISATEFFSRAAAFNPNEYYSVRAAELARGETDPFHPVSSTLAFDEVAQRAEAESWLAARLNITDTAALRNPLPALASDAALQRGLELARLDQLPEAGDEFDVARQVHQGDLIALYQLAIMFRDAGAYRPSISTADALIRAAGARVTDAPAFLARLDYPAYYADLIVPEARARGLDPLLVFSLVRQESLFENVAYSTAAAHGLMQIIPSTGQEIANGLKWPDYDRTDLYRPFISIKFGTYYLARQRDGLDGDLYAALAAYNGGPGNSVRWKAASKGDPDLFYETITYSETRLYIRRIAEYYYMYKKLYGEVR